MSGRKIDPNSQYKVFIHNDRKYRYAAVQIRIKGLENGSVKRKILHIGKIDENNLFIPNDNFKLLDQDEKKKYIFPEECNISNLFKVDKDEEKDINKNNNVSTNSNESLDNSSIFNNRLYGSFWLLENIARQAGLFDDLLEVFDNNLVKVNEIFSLAIFPYLSGKTYNRFARWQNTHKTLVDYQIKSPYITRLCQSINDNHRMNLIKLRLRRQPKNSIGDCDSTTISAWGKCLADIKWGHNKDNNKLKNTVETITYSLTTHEPIYYRSFAGNTTDISTIRTIISDLKALGVKDLVIMGDRGYISKENMAALVCADIPFILNAKVNQKTITDFLLEIKYDEDGIPENMKYDKEKHLYFTRFSIPAYKITLNDQTEVLIEGLQVNIYLDIRRRIDNIVNLNCNILEEKKIIEEDIEKNNIPSNIKKYNALFDYYKLSEIKDKNNIKQYTLKENAERIKKEKSISGFFASYIYKFNKDCLEILDNYRCRDEHEKNFDIFKNKMNYNIQRNSSEDGKIGRMFIGFVGLIPVIILQEY